MLRYTVKLTLNINDMWGASFAEMFYKNLNVKIHCETNVKY